MGIRLPNRRRFRGAARLLALGMAVNVLTALHPAHASPADIFTIAAPVIGTAPPQASNIADGDATVSTQTGSLNYSYPIPVPPGRHNMAPSLSLTYSSQAPIYGGIAAGWSLSVPMITQDTTQGILVMQNGSAPQYQSSMAGGRYLVPVIGDDHLSDVTQTYRAQNDATFTRYEQLNYSVDEAYWRARTSDGMTYTFGAHSNTFTCATVSAGYAPLTTLSDAFGNQVNYNYSPGVSGECLLANITWGRNDKAGMSDFASITFSWSVTPVPSACPARTQIGAQTSYRTGTKIVTGANELDTILVNAYPPGLPESSFFGRVISLSYSPPAGGRANRSLQHGSRRISHAVFNHRKCMEL